MSQSSSPFDLSGRVAVVTGGSRGIGRVIAETFAAAGAHVVIASRKADACEQAAAEIRAATGRRVIAVPTHVGHWDECGRLADAVHDEFGRCDVLVNNAGMSPLYPSLGAVTEDYFDRVIGVNLKGPFRLASLFGERMAAADGGSIINVSTIGSLTPSSTETVYSAAKAGLNAVTVGLAEAYAPRVRSNAILPGVVRTDITKAWTAEQWAQFTAAVPLGRPGEPGDFAGTALWLASDASAWVTGTLIRVDGGMFRRV
jgi:NAD(P)-dependent dehydrogenase (short-subunit alcohol dehydrogenase family)